MMLGPAFSAAAAGLGAGACDLPPNIKYAPRQRATATPPIVSFPLSVDRNDAFPLCAAPKLGASISAAAACTSADGFGAGAFSACGVILTLGPGCTFGVTAGFFGPPTASLDAGGAVGLPHGFAVGVAAGFAVSVAVFDSALGFDSALCLGSGFTSVV